MSSDANSLSVVLQLNKRDYTENSHVEFCPNVFITFFLTFKVSGICGKVQF